MTLSAITVEKLNNLLDLEELEDMIHEEVDGMTISGDDCPECDSEDYYGHLELASEDGSIGMRLVTDCMWCGNSESMEFFDND